MSTAHMGFQTDTRSLTTPIHPGHYYDTGMSLTNDVFSDPQVMIDPSLTAVDPITRPPVPWQVYSSSWKQYPKDPMSSYLMFEQTPSFQNHYAPWQSRTEPASLAPFGRHESPISQLPGFSSGESLSPPTESDTCPRTPPYTSSSDPYQQPFGSDAWDAPQTQILFKDLGHAHESLSVNPYDVNPSQATTDDSVALSRSPSFGPDLGSKLNGRRSFDPFEHEPSHSVQAEIQVCTPTESVYPDPDKDADAEPEVSQDDKKDEDWTPKRTRRRSGDGKAVVAAARSGARNTRKRVKKETGTSTANSAPPRAAPKAPATGRACDVCDETFRDEVSLEKHRKSKHLRPFTCIFHFAGCKSSFPSKNEWKRHVMTQHLALHYWLCTQGACGKGINPAPPSRRSAQLPDGAIFNRKDLYTQHVRRMHVPNAYNKNHLSKALEAEWEGQLRELQGEAIQTRCQLPEFMKCPSTTCTQEFHGTNAWDERMEHVAKHLDKASEGREGPLSFGGTGDPTLTVWAEKPEVGVVRKVAEGRWELVNMLRGVAGPSNGHGKGKGASRAAASRKRRAEEEPEDEEDDAEGEDD
ncbi:hypothetical protein B0T11DRAFT_104175 [Plectosphaerella cucumerina]|uniref:C2H2-type domain-containing protein n=1 Tax=Plectosphaerella cucumerina TaxID=40658 RepID=A0A8K0X361_9PEZI|nr:hypothetical protein B0T11DRAFT_104175 [Plectosphaerella cucumerina]